MNVEFVTLSLSINNSRSVEATITRVKRSENCHYAKTYYHLTDSTINRLKAVLRGDTGKPWRIGESWHSTYIMVCFYPPKENQTEVR